MQFKHTLASIDTSFLLSAEALGHRYNMNHYMIHIFSTDTNTDADKAWNLEFRGDHHDLI